MSPISIIALIVALAALAGVYLAFAATRRQFEGLLREMNHSDPTAPNEEIPGTSYVYCDGDCVRVNRQNNKLKCRPSGCTGTDCACHVFRRVSPVPQDWDGKYEYVGKGSEEHSKDAGYAYFCWCAKSS